MHLFHLHARRRRAHGALVLLFLILGSLGFTIFQTQVLRNPAYALQSDRNRLRPLVVPGPRGTVFDRNGEIVAENVPGYALLLLPAPPDSVRATLESLASLLDLSEPRIDALLARQQRFPAEPLMVSGNLTFEQVSAVEERRPLFPEVLIETQPKRRYPGGAATAHLTGYVAEVSEEDLAEERFRGYQAGQLVGKRGLERAYEARLAGRPGTRYVEVDALGRIVGDWAPQPQVRPLPGEDLHLHIDLALQRWIHAVFPDGGRGAVAAIEPRSGHVLALYSAPSFDPNRFVGGVDPLLWQQLQADSAKPLLNRAITGSYPPGSTWKLASAAIALDLGVVDPTEPMPLPCRGGMRYGNRYFKCWEPLGHGELTLPDAISRSCDVYFYQLGLKVGLERLLAEGVRLGFAGRTGVDLPAELPGTFPPEPDWYRRRFGAAPTEAEVLNLAIGQGPNDQTALKMAHFYAALASGGSVPAPRVAAEAPVAGPRLSLNLAPETLEWLLDGLGRVVAPGGTAHLSSLEHWDWIGKTGTSQNPHGPDHGWFVGMAGPKGARPEIVVATVVEFGEHGSDVAQIGSKVADYYLRTKHRMPIDTIQTLREHLRARRPAPWARWR